MTDAAIRQNLLRVAPKRGLVRTVGVSVLLVAVPVFGVLTFLGVHNGTWRIGTIGALVTLAACIFIFIRYRHTSITVTDRSIEERGFWGGHNAFARTDATAVDLVHTYSPSVPEPAPQLLVLGADDRCLLRMRGVFWTAEAMHEVAAYLDPVMRVNDEAMTALEFYERYPGAAYWIEHRPIMRGIAIAALAAVVLALIFVLSALVSVPVTG